MASFNGPKLTNPIRTDVPDTHEVLVALAKQDPTSISDIPAGVKRLYEGSSGKWQWQEYNGSSWAAVPFLQHNVDQLDGYHAAITPAANTVAVRNASGLLEDSIAGNAATASSAATLSQTLPVNKGGTGATTSEAARSNLGVPPTSHTSTNTTYGVGNATEYGHLKLSDATDSVSGVSGGTAATPAAVKVAKDAADAAQSSANNAQSSADAAMTKASTLATSSTPGIVKPGTGLQIGEEGALNVVAEQTGCLPLTGGTMTGPITFGTTNLASPSDGAITFGGKNIVRSVNGVNADAAGNVSDVTASGSTNNQSYIRFSNGLQICRGNGVTGGNVTFPVAFISSPTVQIITDEDGKLGSYCLSLSNRGTTGFYPISRKPDGTWVTGLVIIYTAIGWWK